MRAADIYNKTYVTVEIYIQGGIVAANGINGIQNDFKVYPVQMVFAVSKAKREKRDSGRRNSGSPSHGSFASILQTAAEEHCAEEACSVTYDRQSLIHTYAFRQTREYTC